MSRNVPEIRHGCTRRDMSFDCLDQHTTAVCTRVLMIQNYRTDLEQQNKTLCMSCALINKRPTFSIHVVLLLLVPSLSITDIIVPDSWRMNVPKCPLCFINKQYYARLSEVRENVVIAD